jgi:hypothetical protein
MPDHTALQALLQDRKTSKKGRAFKRMTICLDAEKAEALTRAEDEKNVIDALVKKAEANADQRAGGKVAIDPELTGRLKAAEKALAEADKAFDAAAVRITFTALKAHDFDELLKAHPPREGNMLDAAADRNESTFPDALMHASASKVEDAEGNLIDMDAADLLETLSDGERIVACQASNDVNSERSTADFFDANSRSRRRSGSN